MAVTRADWNGLVAAARIDEADISLIAPLAQSSRGGSGAFQGRGDDGNRYWLKPLNNCQGPMVPATEQIIGRVGELIGAPTCIARTARIPTQLAGWEFRPGHALASGIAHASLAIENAVETHQMQRRANDENARRHAFLLALYDWCWGGDPQWLMDLSRDSAFHSHDHGWYLPPNGPRWDEAELLAHVNDSHEYRGCTEAGIGKGDVADIASALRSVHRGQLVAALSRIPASWPIPSEHLECVGFFLETRTIAVADRIEARFGV